MKKFEPHYRLVRVGMATKIEKASRQQRTWREYQICQIFNTDPYHRQATQEPHEDPHRYRQGQGCQDQEGQISASPRFPEVVCRVSFTPDVEKCCFGRGTWYSQQLQHTSARTVFNTRPSKRYHHLYHAATVVMDGDENGVRFLAFRSLHPLLEKYDHQKVQSLSRFILSHHLSCSS